MPSYDTALSHFFHIHTQIVWCRFKQWVEAVQLYMLASCLLIVLPWYWQIEGRCHRDLYWLPWISLRFWLNCFVLFTLISMRRFIHFIAIFSRIDAVAMSYDYAIVRINSLGPSDAIWRWRSWSTLVQVMACCLTAPSHYLNQCWLIISKVLWHSSEDIIIRFEDTNQ